MAMNLLVILACLLATAPSVLAQDPEPPRAQTPTGSPAKPAYPFLERTFAASLTPEQTRGLGDGAALDKIARILTPEQKTELRRRLDAARADATTPDELKEIAQGYLLLNTPGPESGKNVVALAARLQKLEPAKSDGYTIAADGYYLSGDYPAAAEQARQAWEVSKHTDTRAWALLKMSEGRTAAAPAEVVVSKPPSDDFARLDLTVPEKNDISPEAMTLVRQAIAARRRGDMNVSWIAMQSAMNADPTSTSMQEVYSFAKSDHVKYVETKDLLVRSREALDAGRGAEAVELARKAVERSGGDDTVQKIYELAQQRSADLGRRQAATPPTEPRGGMPLWPLGAALGLSAAGYGFYRGSKRTYASEDGHEPAPAQTPEEARNLALGFLAAGGALLLGVGAAEFGPGALSAVRAFAAASGPSAPGMHLAAAGGGGGSIVVNQDAAIAGLQAAGIATAAAGVGAMAMEHVSYSKHNASSAGEPPRPHLNAEDAKRLEDDANSLDPADKGGKLTKAGRSLVKHAVRSGSKLPSASGAPEAINVQARGIIRAIFEDPKEILHSQVKGWGEVIDIIGRDGVGVRYTASGRFMYFLD